MRAILRLLVELYQYADLKLNLKFEVEVLCKNLQVEIKGMLCVANSLFVACTLNVAT